MRKPGLGPFVALLVIVSGCEQPAQKRMRASDGRGPSAATVNGEAIALVEVEQLVAESALSPKEALRRLVAERLLAQHAEARGYDELAEIERETKRARVRAVLASEVEAKLDEADVAGRRERLAHWLAELHEAAAIKYDEAAIERALATLH